MSDTQVNQSQTEQYPVAKKGSVQERIIAYLEEHYPDANTMGSARAMTQEIRSALGEGSLATVNSCMGVWREKFLEIQTTREAADSIGYGEVTQKLTDAIWEIIAPVIEKAKRNQLQTDQVQIEEMKKALELANADLESAETLRDTLQAQCQEQLSNITQLKGKVDQLQERVNDQEASIEDTTHRLISTTTERDAALATIEKQQTQMNAERNELLTKYESQIAALNDKHEMKIESVRQTLQQTERELATLQAQIEGYRLLKTEFQTLRSDYDELRDRFVDSQQQCALYRQSKEAGEEQNAVLRSSLETMTEKCDAALKSLAVAETRSAMLEKMIQEQKDAFKLYQEKAASVNEQTD